MMWVDWTLTWMMRSISVCRLESKRYSCVASDISVPFRVYAPLLRDLCP